MRARALWWPAGLLLALYGMVYADLVLRARSAYREGERYMDWELHPQTKRAYFETEFQKEKTLLDRERAGGSLSETEYLQRVELERFRTEEAVAESSLKYAYHWYKTAVDLFSPPESRWVRLSRSRMAEAKARWKRELEGKRIPYEEYMLE